MNLCKQDLNIYNIKYRPQFLINYYIIFLKNSIKDILISYTWLYFSQPQTPYCFSIFAKPSLILAQSYKYEAPIED